MLKIVIFHVDLHFFAEQLRVAENAQARTSENMPHAVRVDILYYYMVGIPAVYVDVDVRGNIHHLAQDVVSRGKQGIRPLFLAEFDNEKDDSKIRNMAPIPPKMRPTIKASLSRRSAASAMPSITNVPPKAV